VKGVVSAAALAPEHLALAEQVAGPQSMPLRPYLVERSIPAEQCTAFRGSMLCWSPVHGLGYASPLPPAQELAHFYTHEYRVVMTKARGLSFYLESPNYRAQARSQVSWVLPLVPPRGCWLDVGAAFGLLLWQVRQDLPAWELHAVEPAEDAQEQLAKLAEVETDFGAFWRGESTSAKHYDLISLSHVLEHLLDPLAALSLLRSRLKPGGLLLLEVPNDHLLELIRAERRSDLPHLWFFSRDGLIQIASAAGFEVLRAAEIGLRRPSISAPLPQRVRRYLRTRARGRLSLCSDADWYAEAPDRCDLRLLCRKPA
jgi:SAM-dependent methyltransferase